MSTQGSGRWRAAAPVSEPLVLSNAVTIPRPLRLALAGGAAADWYESVPRGADEWRTRLVSIRDEFAAADWFGALAPAVAARGAAADRLARVAHGRGVLVTSGQQPGLFGGPMYTWSKALSALAVADALEAATNVPTAPVFWAATYDADFAEASVTYVAAGDRVERLALPTPSAEGHAMHDTPLGDVSALLAVLRREAGAAAAPHLLDLVGASYAPGETVGSAFVALLRALLEPLGIAVLDAGHPAVQTAERPFLLRALRDAATIDTAVRQRDEALRALGCEPKVASVHGLSLVFASGAEGRRRIPIAAAGRGVDGALEPNVLLRPVAERVMLPTVAYVAGPAEVAYFAQATAAADALGVPRPLAVPRWSGTIVEPHVRRILERYGLAVEDLRDPHAALGRLVRGRVAADLQAALEGYRAALDRAADRLARAIGDGDPPLVPDAVLEGARRSIGHRLDRLERRIVAAAKRRERDLEHDLAVARTSLFPLEKPQERVLNLMPLLARHGTTLLDAMLDQARAHARSLDASLPRGDSAHEPAGGRR